MSLTTPSGNLKLFLLDMEREPIQFLTPLVMAAIVEICLKEFVFLLALCLSKGDIFLYGMNLVPGAW